jgi:hypothetical protein
LRDAHTADERAYVDAARTALTDLEHRIAHVRLEVTALQTGDVLELDGNRIASATVGAAMPVDPGEHIIRVTRGEHTAMQRSFTLEPGASRSVTLLLPAVVASHVTPLPAPVERHMHPHPRVNRGSPWVAVGIVAGALVLSAVAVVVGVLVFAQPSQENAPLVGNFPNFGTVDVP